VKVEAEALTSDPSVDFAPGGPFYKPPATGKTSPPQAFSLDPATQKFKEQYERQYAEKHKQSVGK